MRGVDTEEGEVASWAKVPRQGERGTFVGVHTAAGGWGRNLGRLVVATGLKRAGQPTLSTREPWKGFEQRRVMV